jgi:uncharacterized membrane protein
MESTKRSIFKTLSWPLVHFTFVAGIIYFTLRYFTGEAEWEYVGLYGISYVSLEMIFYFTHERMWAKFGHKVK